MEFNYLNAVNVFTDASNLPAMNGRKENIICPAYIVSINGSVLEYGSRLIKNATAAYGELYALAMGVQAATRYAYTGMPIYIYSDSEISVSACTKWLEKWYMNGRDNFYLTKGDKNPAANQELVLDIVKMVCQANMRIGLINILGHTRNEDVSAMEKFRYYFYRANHINGRVPIEHLQNMALFNDKVDTISRTALKNICNPNHPIVNPKEQVPGIYWYPKDEDIQLYLSLVNK
jgi:ribonuclease HI